jgi:hypothetical protein
MYAVYTHLSALLNSFGMHKSVNTYTPTHLLVRWTCLVPGRWYGTSCSTQLCWLPLTVFMVSLVPGTVPGRYGTSRYTQLCWLLLTAFAVYHGNGNGTGTGTIPSLA